MHFREGECVMQDHLQQLIDAARVHQFTPEERKAPRRSFAYGNTKIENDRVTREMVDEQDELLKVEPMLETMLAKQLLAIHQDSRVKITSCRSATTR